MKVLIVLVFSLIVGSCRPQSCKNLPVTFTSYSEAIGAVKNATFKVKESAGTFQSSWITSAFFYSCDGETGYFIFSTVQGHTYIHKDLPLSLWRDFKSASSKGGYYNRYIKGRYRLQL